MSNYVIVNPGFGGGPPVTQTDSTPRFPLGVTMLASDLGTASTGTQGAGTAATANAVQYGYGRFVYVQGSNLASSGMCAMLVPQTTGGIQAVAATAATNSLWPVGINAAVLNATSQYGWVQVEGICDFIRLTNSSAAAGVGLYQAGTAGVIAAASAAASQYAGINLITSYTSSQVVATGYLANPRLIGAGASI